MAEDSHESPVSGAGITEQMLWFDLVGYLPDDILAKLDRAAMAVSLETRVPFLDRGILDLAWRLPLMPSCGEVRPSGSCARSSSATCRGRLVERPKMGFGLPIGAWLRGVLAPWAEHLLDERRLREQGLLDPAPIRRAWDLHQRGRRDWATSCGTSWSCSRGWTGGCPHGARAGRRIRRHPVTGRRAVGSEMPKGGIIVQTL